MRYALKVFPLVFLAVFAVSAAGFAAGGAAGGQPRESRGQQKQVFSQGQAVYDPQDHARSQQQAIHDFLAQAITQATSSFLTPTQMGVSFPQLQKKIFSQPERYVDTYQIYSESPSGEQYLVVGQVSVAMDILLRDLKEQGLVAADAELESPGAQPKPRGEPQSQASSGQAAEPAVSPAEKEDEAGAGIGTGRGLTTTRKDVLWVVPEKWEQEFLLPQDKRDPHALLAISIAQELLGYHYSVQLPEQGAVRMDISGAIAPSQAVSLAEGLGIRRVVLGTLILRQEKGNLARLEAALRVLESPSGKVAGEIRNSQPLEDLSNQEGAMELASRIAPQLDRLFDSIADRMAGPRAPGENHETGKSGETGGPPGEGAAASSGDSGEWVLLMQPLQFTYWRELEKTLRDQFKTMTVTSLEMGAGVSTVKVAGVDGALIAKMDGVVLPSGTQVRVEGNPQGPNSFRLSFVPPGKSKQEPNQ